MQSILPPSATLCGHQVQSYCGHLRRSQKSLREENVLPLLDLIIWKQEYNCSISHAVKAKLLFPHHDENGYIRQPKKKSKKTGSKGSRPSGSTETYKYVKITSLLTLA
ncbi:DUF6387 family protein [Edaphobacter modestus]|uniref:DUF6387 family protein n=1 Tax=Edaphobacter modestus TaxID=388466 RepID=UPI003BF88D9F